MKRGCMALVCAISGAFALAAGDVGSPDNTEILENGFFRLVVSPYGGRVTSFRAKFLDAELTNPKAGSFMEYDWMRRNRFFYRDKPFVLTRSGAGGEKSLTAYCGCLAGSGTEFLTTHRTYTLSEDSTSLRVDYEFGNHPNAMSAQDYALLIHTTLGVSGSLCSYYFPSVDGIVEIERDKRPKDMLIAHPSRGWMAAVDDRGRGVAVTMPYRDVGTFFSWLASDDVPTLEWRMIPFTIDEGKSYSLPTEILVFKGLGRVSGAGGGLVGEIADGTVRVYNCRAGRVTAKADGETHELEFAAPGELKTFASAATTVILEIDGKEACRLEAKPGSGEWNIKPLEARRVSTVKGYDLTGFTNFPHQVCRPFAKPLAVRKPRVIALTGWCNAVELGFFADRFDCELLTSQVSISGGKGKRGLANPQYASGDHFAKVSTPDVEENLLKTLAKPADAILIGGLPWEMFPKDVQKAILGKVKGGTGLVWIGQDRAAPEILRTGKPKRIVRRTVPEAVGEAFADVPFALLGEEPVYAFEPTGTVHAKAGGAAYLTEGRIGGGTVIHLAYEAIFGRTGARSGLTPDLRDVYPDRIAPAEYYYSLIAKCVLRACGRELPARIRAMKVDGSAACLTVAASAAGRATLTWGVRAPFGDLLADGRADLDLTAGENRTTVDFADLAPHAGPLAFEAVLRDAEGRVMAWGDWSFAKPPVAQLAGLASDRAGTEQPNYREGDVAKFAATVKGPADGLALSFELADSFGRTLDRKEIPAAAKAEVAFTLTDGLPTRLYALTARLMKDGREIDRRRTEVWARPEPSKWAWDDFLLGVWANDGLRTYLWPERAKRFRTMNLSLNVATETSTQIDFPVRYGFDPTFKASAGIGRCGEPPEFVKTGDKMTLVRTPCLSDPAFLSKMETGHRGQARKFANLGLRVVWFGDEQSLTGKGSTSIDFCFSEHCLKAFREFLRGRYGTLERLNGEWGTSFADWEKVLPFTRQEVWSEGGERHIAGWADHLEFMDGRLANSLALCTAAYKAEDPNVQSSISGTQAPKAYGGADWWKQIRYALEGALSYGTGGQFDLHRSFRPDGSFMPWNWGYSRCGAAAVEDLWLTVFNGSRGIIGFTDPSIVNMDWTWSGPYAELKPSLDHVASGVGKHFIQNLKPEPEVAVLYSHASIRAAFFENREAEHMQLREKYILLLRQLGRTFDFVSYEQLADGTFGSRGYKALVLPDICAMGEDEIAAVERFAAKGGTVLAEGVPARRTANCRPRADSPLKRFAVWPTVDIGYLKARENPSDPENAKRVAAEQDRLEKALDAAGVGPSGLAMADAADGSRIRDAQVFTRRGRNGARFWGVLPRVEKERTVEFAFATEGWLCDLVTSKLIGRGRTFRLPADRGHPRAFELLPEKPVLGGLDVADGKVTVAYTPSVDTVVRIRVYGPDGQEVPHYAKSLVVRDGSASWRIPFALSDAAGRWRVTATDVLTGETVAAFLEKSK